MSTSALKPAHETIPARLSLICDTMLAGGQGANGSSRALEELVRTIEETTFPIKHIDEMCAALNTIVARLRGRSYNAPAETIGRSVENLMRRKRAAADATAEVEYGPAGPASTLTEHNPAVPPDSIEAVPDELLAAGHS